MDRITRAPRVNPELAGAGGGLLNSLFTPFVRAITGGIADTLDGLANHSRMQREELAGLQSRTQELEGVVGYGNTYMQTTTAWTVDGWNRLRFTEQVGPAVGCSVRPDGGFTLHSRGLWRVDAQVFFSWLVIQNSKMQTEIRVFAPDGTLHQTKLAELANNNEASLASALPFTVPGPGYYVELWAWAASGREIIGGSSHNHLALTKLSTETT